MLRRLLFSSTPFRAQSGLVTKFETKWKRFVREKACAKSTSNNGFLSKRRDPRLPRCRRFQRFCNTDLLHHEFADFESFDSRAPNCELTDRNSAYSKSADSQSAEC